MKDELSAEQIENIAEALDKALKDGPWDESSLLKIVGKNLNNIKEKFVYKAEDGDASGKIKAHLANRIALRKGQQEVFIRVYSTDGNNISSWEKILANLPKQLISRPIYGNEKDIKAILKSKDNHINEAYVSIYVNKSDILSVEAERTPVDKLGKPLLQLKDKALKLDNVHYFMHTTGVYKYENGRLIKDNQAHKNNHSN